MPLSQFKSPKSCQTHCRIIARSSCGFIVVRGWDQTKVHIIDQIRPPATSQISHGNENIFYGHPTERAGSWHRYQQYRRLWKQPRLSPLGTSATVGLLYQPRMIDDHYGAVGGMRIGRGRRSTRRKPAPVPLFPPQIPHDLTWDRIRAAAMGNRRLTAWAMARPAKAA
jgi:hypothetical protein